MDMSLQKTLRESLDKIEAHRAELRHNLDQADTAAEGLRRLLSSITDDNGDSAIAGTSVAPARLAGYGESPPSNGTPTASGLHGGLSRRQVILRRIIPEFEGGTFSPRDVRLKYLEMYPERNTKSLSPTVSSLLRELAEKGEIERVGRGDKSTDPWMYRAKKSNKETLLSP